MVDARMFATLLLSTAEPLGLSGLGWLFDWLCVAFGLIGLGLAGALGAAAWVMALRARLDSSAKVFGRGFLGVSSVLCFLLGGLALWFGAMGTGLRLGHPVAWAFALLAAALTFMSVEFAVAGALYRRVHRATGRTGANILGITSVILGAVFSLAALAAIALTISTALDP